MTERGMGKNDTKAISATVKIVSTGKGSLNTEGKKRRNNCERSLKDRGKKSVERVGKKTRGEKEDMLKGTISDVTAMR